MWDSVQTMQGQIHLYHSFEILLAVTFSEIEWLNANYRFWLLLSVRRQLHCNKVCVVVVYQLLHLHVLGGGDQHRHCPLLPVLCSRAGFVSTIRY